MKHPPLSIPLAVALVGMALAIHPTQAVTLEDCRQAARENNPTLEAAVHRIEAAQAAAHSSRSGYYPTLTAAGAYTLTDNPGQAFFMNLNQRQASLQNDFNDPPDTDNFRGSLAFKWLLLDAGQRGLMSAMAERGAQAAVAMRDAAFNELDYQVTRAFYAAKQAAALVAVSEETINSLEEHLRVANERFTAGSAIKTDVLNLEVQLAEAREMLIRARNGVQLAIATLNASIGMDLIADADALAYNSESIPPPPATGVDEHNATQRPEYKAIELQAEAAALDATRAGRDRAPRVSAFGSLDYDSDSLNDFEDSYFAGAVVEMDIFTGFRRRSDIAEAKARAQEAGARRDELLLQLRLDIKQSHLQAVEAWERWQVARQSLASSEEALRITRERYEQGAAEITELLTAQIGRTATQNRTVAARYDYEIARANVRRATATNLTDSNPETTNE